MEEFDKSISVKNSNQLILHVENQINKNYKKIRQSSYLMKCAIK